MRLLGEIATAISAIGFIVALLFWAHVLAP